MNDLKALGYGGKQRLPSGKSTDGTYKDPKGKSGRVPVELKPNNKRKIREGWKQLEQYEIEMGAPAGSGQLWVYDIGPTGQIFFTRVL